MLNEAEEQLAPILAMEEDGIISRFAIYRHRPLFRKIAASFCMGNSIWTSIQFVLWVQTIIMGRSNALGYLLGFAVALALTIGQFVNANSIDEEHEKKYIGFLIPDAAFTAVYWVPWVFSILASIIMVDERVSADTYAAMSRVLHHAWSVGLVWYFLICLAAVLAVTICGAFGIWSAKYPEVAFAGTRWSEQLKGQIRAALRME